MNKAVSGAILLVCVFGTFGTASAQPLTLAEAMGIAYETNPQLLAQQAALRATD